MDSEFLQKLEEEKKMAHEGKALDEQMREEDEEDEDEDEANDGVQALAAVHDGIGALHF